MEEIGLELGARRVPGAIGDFTLTDPLDAVFLQDDRVFHGVTAIRALESDQVARRDVAVITFCAAPPRVPSPV